LVQNEFQFFIFSNFGFVFELQTLYSDPTQIVLYWSTYVLYRPNRIVLYRSTYFIDVLYRPSQKNDVESKWYGAGADAIIDQIFLYWSQSRNWSQLIKSNWLAYYIDVLYLPYHIYLCWIKMFQSQSQILYHNEPHNFRNHKDVAPVPGRNNYAAPTDSFWLCLLRIWLSLFNFIFASKGSKDIAIYCIVKGKESEAALFWCGSGSGKE
jgi:hypothetical protein